MIPTEFSRDDREDEIRGVAIGIVTDNVDPERMGRVLLTFPWRGADDESYWARVAAPMAGEGMGAYFLPEVGDEVLVAFDDGDVQHPYVLGALWNGKERPPEDNSDGKNNRREIRSRSGHELVFDDSTTEGKVELKTSTGDKVVLDDSTTEGKIEIETSAGHKITLDDSTGREKISIVDKSGQEKIEFDSVRRSLEISSGMKLSIKAPVLEIKGDTSVSVESSGILSLKGSIIKLN